MAIEYSKLFIPISSLEDARTKYCIFCKELNTTGDKQYCRIHKKNVQLTDSCEKFKQTENIFCPKCKEKIEIGVNNCPNCNRKLVKGFLPGKITYLLMFIIFGGSLFLYDSLRQVDNIFLNLIGGIFFFVGMFFGAGIAAQLFLGWGFLYRMLAHGFTFSRISR